MAMWAPDCISIQENMASSYYARSNLVWVLAVEKSSTVKRITLPWLDATQRNIPRQKCT